MRLIISGPDIDAMDSIDVVQKALSSTGWLVQAEQLVVSGWSNIEIAAKVLAKKRGLKVRIVRPLPRLTGKAAYSFVNAGLIRNADALIAIHSGGCARTEHLIESAKDSNLQIHEERL